MTFSAAMALILEGKTVRRDSWPGDGEAGLRLNRGGFMAWAGDGWIAALRKEFMLAEDWVEVTPRETEPPDGQLTDDPRLAWRP